MNTNAFLSKVMFTLAGTMIPTIIGIFLGLHIAPTIIHMGAIFSILSLVVCIGLMFGVFAAKDSPLGFFLLFLFTFVMGISISLNLISYFASAAGILIVAKAFISSVVIFTVMGIIGATTKRDLSGMGTILMVVLIGLIITSIVNIFLHSTMMNMVISAIASIVFSLFAMYDMQKIVRGNINSVTSATISLYLDFVNLFLNILDLFGEKRG